MSTSFSSFKSKKSFQCVSTICAILFCVFSFTSTAHAALYAPGTTLEPDCPPTESLSTCGVIAPLTVTGSAQELTLARIGSSTFSTMQEMQNVFHSAGWTSGGDITDAGGGTVNVAAGTGLIRSANTAIATISYFDWDAVSGIAIPNNSIRYIGLEYNGGSPQVVVRTSSNWNLKTDFSIGVVVNESGSLSIYSDKQAVGDHAANMIQREYETMPLSRDERSGGLMLDETGARNVTVSAGAVWDRLNRFAISEVDTSGADTFSAYYMDGSSGFTKVTGLTQWPNTQYDDGDGTLATMTDNYFATLWFYVDTNGEISMVYGMGEYVTAALADAEMAPENVHLPNRLAVFGKLLGKIVFQKSASTAADVSTAFSGHGGGGGLTGNHANLTGLDYVSSGHTGFAMSGVNSNITSLTGLTTALSAGQGGTGLSSYTSGDILYASGSTTLSKLNIGTEGQVLKVSTGALVWGTDVHLGNTNLTLTGARGLALNGNSLTIDGSTGDTVFSDNGNVTIGGDLTVTGDDVFLGTNTLGALLVADGTNFNPVVLSGDASINASGALTINYNAAQSASAVNKGFLTAADWTTFNSKQAALGFTAEDVANKSTDTALGTSDTLYPTQKAVKAYADNLALGLNWKNPVELVNVIADTATPVGSPTNLDAYIINTGGATGAWSAFTVGDLIQYQANQWVLIKSLAVGDRFGVSFKSATTPSGSMTGKNDNMVEITGGSAGAFTYTFTAPTNNDALFVDNANAYYNNISFSYSSSLGSWVQFSASTNYTFANGLNTSGNTISLGALTSDWTQSGAFDIVTAGDINVNGGDLKTTNGTATLFNTGATTLNIGGAATTIGLGAAGATVTGGGALVISSGASTALTLDSGTTGTLNLGTGNNAKTINLGTGTAGNSINIGTNNSVADTITIGSALDALSLTSTGLNVTTLGALTGVASINTVTHSATAVTFAGAGTLSSTGVNSLTVDSGTTGGVNIGTGSNAKTITIGNTTGATTLNLQSGTGNIGLQVAGTGTTGNVQIGAGGGGSATPDLLVMDIKSTSGDPTGTNGAMYYNSNTGKFRCFENSAWANCITPPGSDIQHVTSYDTNESLTNITSSQTTLGTVSITPSSATGDIYVTGQADVISSNAIDQTFVLTIETGATCAGSTVGNATRSYVISSASGVARGTIIVSGIAVDPGASSQSYSLCASTATGDTDVMNWRIEATVIDTGADLAEIYTTNDANIEAGDVVSLDSNLKTGVKKSTGTLDQNVIGIVSTRPGMVIGGIDQEGVNAVPVALSGRVPVKVITENGSIESGDFLSPSSVSGVAMKASGTGPVIGQALSSYSGEGVGTVVVFVKNFNLGGIGETSVLLGDITPKTNNDGSDNGLSTIVATIQTENVRDPAVIIGQKISEGKQFLTDFVSARVTAIRGYFDEVFAKKVHTDQLCVKKSDGSEICVSGDQIDTLLDNAGISPIVNTTTPTPDPEPTPDPQPIPEPAPEPIPTPVTPSETSTTTPEVITPPADEPAPTDTPTPDVVIQPTETPVPEPTASASPPTEQPADTVLVESQ